MEWRLLATGVTLASVKHRAVVCHLHHPANYSGADRDGKGGPDTGDEETLTWSPPGNRTRSVHFT